MKKLSVIGIGAGHPDFVSAQAVAALNAVDVFFVVDKGVAARELLELRRAICERHIEHDDYRFVTVTDPERDRTPLDYRNAVTAWHEARTDAYEAAILRELPGDGVGGILVWGDPALYDSTLRIVDALRARDALDFEVEVVPGISSAQALAAAHQVPLHPIGEPVLVTTGRHLAAEGVPDAVGNVVVMLDGDCSFRKVDPDAYDIYWGAYLGTPDQILVSGRLAVVGDEIVRRRAEARERKGWIMDVYLLRRVARE
jgi:precorrin-6A synthase